MFLLLLCTSRQTLSKLGLGGTTKSNLGQGQQGFLEYQRMHFVFKTLIITKVKKAKSANNKKLRPNNDILHLYCMEIGPRIIKIQNWAGNSQNLKVAQIELNSKRFYDSFPGKS